MSLILEHGNRLEDAFLMLFYMADGIDLESLKKKHCSQNKDETFEMEKKFDALIHIYQYVTTALESKKGEIQRLFKSLGQNYASLAALSILWDTRSYFENLTSYQEKLSSTNLSGRIQEFTRILDDQESTAGKDKDQKEMEEFITFLEQSTNSKEDCFEILKVLYHPEDYYEPTSQILSKAMDLLKDCSKEIEFLERSFFQYWTEYEKIESVFHNVKKYINCELPDSKLGVVIRPRLFHPLTITLSLDAGEEEKEDIVDLGIMVNKSLVFDFSRLVQSDVIKIGKVFADKSKLDILEFVKKTPAFGKELAKQMNLTTATISYHVNSLLELGFLKTTIEGGRVYYQTNVERIQEVLKQLEQYVAQELT